MECFAAGQQQEGCAGIRGHEWAGDSCWCRGWGLVDAMSTCAEQQHTALCWSRHSSGGMHGVLTARTALPVAGDLYQDPKQIPFPKHQSRRVLSPAGSVHQRCVQCHDKGQELHNRAVHPTQPYGSAKHSAGQTQPLLPLLQNPSIHVKRTLFLEYYSQVLLVFLSLSHITLCDHGGMVHCPIETCHIDFE